MIYLKAGSQKGIKLWKLALVCYQKVKAKLESISKCFLKNSVLIQNTIKDLV